MSPLASGRNLRRDSTRIGPNGPNPTRLFPENSLRSAPPETVVTFVSTTICTGPVAKAINGVDVSFAVGVSLATALYYDPSRSLDLRSEARAACATRAIREHRARTVLSVDEELV